MKLLDGHKTQIAGACSIILTFVVAKGYIDNDMAVMIGGLLTIVFGASVFHHEKKKVNAKKQAKKILKNGKNK